MKISKYIFLRLLLIPLLFVNPITSQAAKYAGEFLNIGLGSRAMGMGGAYTSMAEGGFGGYWNAASSVNSHHQVIFAHSSDFGSLVSHDALGYCQPMKQSAIGFIYSRLAIDDIPYTNDALLDLNNNGIMDYGERLDTTKIAYNSDVESALILNYSRRYNTTTQAGLNLKIVNKSVGSNSAWGLGIDFGAISTKWEKFKLGFNIQDLTTTYLAWDNGTNETISPTVRLGGSYHPLIKDEQPLSLALAGDFRFEGRKSAANISMGEASVDLHLGAEFWIKKTIALRIGNDQGNFTAGAGLNIGRLSFDYAFADHTYLESSSKLSGSITF